MATSFPSLRMDCIVQFHGLYQRYVHCYAFGKHKKDKFSSRLSFVQFDNQDDSDCDNSDRWMKVIMVENWKSSE